MLALQTRAEQTWGGMDTDDTDTGRNRPRTEQARDGTGPGRDRCRTGQPPVVCRQRQPSQGAASSSRGAQRVSRLAGGTLRSALTSCTDVHSVSASRPFDACAAVTPSFGDETGEAQRG